MSKLEASVKNSGRPQKNRGSALVPRVLFAAGVVWVIASNAVYISSVERIRKATEHENAAGMALINRVFERCMAQGDTLVSHLSDLRGEDFTEDTATLRQVIADQLSSYQDICGAGIAFNPQWIARQSDTGDTSGKNHSGRLSLFMIKNENGAPESRVIPYDYTDTTLPTACWYTRPQATRKACWAGPYYGEASQRQCVDLSKPQFDDAGMLMYIIFATYDLALFRTCLTDSVRFDGGYACLIDTDGSFIHHPRKELMRKGVTVRSIGSETGSSVLAACADSISKKARNVSLSYPSVFTGEKTRLVCNRIDPTGWYMMFIVPDLLGKPLCVFSEQIFLFVFETVLVICIGIIGFGWKKRWFVTLGVSVVFTAGIVALWMLSVKKYEAGNCSTLLQLMKSDGSKNSSRETCTRTYLENRYAAEAFVGSCFDDTTLPLLPVGLVVQTVNFTGNNCFTMSGYLWERYASQKDRPLLGVEFPESEKAEMRQVYDDSLGPGRFVRGWRFFVTIRQPFECRRYPIDEEEISLRMRPAALNESVRLVPDFDGYENGKGAPPGIDEHLVLPKWTLLGSTFSFAADTTRASYGRDGCRPCSKKLELYYSLHIRRNILDAFISQFIPLIVIVLILFLILWISRKKNKGGLAGFDSMKSLSSCTGLFFIVIYNHINLRNQLGAPGVIYAEYFFFIAYLALLLVCINSIMVSLDEKSRIINDDDNMWTRIIYWPGISGILFVVTYLVFGR